MTNDEARVLWSNSGLTYNDMFDNIDLLRLNLEVCFNNHEFKMGLSKKFEYNFITNTRNISDMYLFVNGGYFVDRECISFNKDGFIGFAGWASSTNTEPILEAFVKTMQEIIKLKLSYQEVYDNK